MQAEDPYPISDDVYEQIFSLSSDQHYFLIYPASHMKPSLTFKNMFNKVPIPYLLVFTENDEKEFKEIASQFMKENKINIKLEDFSLSLEKGTVITPYNMGYLKSELRLDTLDGMRIIYNARDLNIGEDFKEECALKTVISSQDTYNHKDVQATFYIKQTKYFFYLPIDGDSKRTIQIFKEVLESVSKEILKTYGVQIETDNISLTTYTNGTEKIIRSSNICTISKKAKIVVTFKKQIKLPLPLPAQLNSYIIFRGQGVEPITFSYEQIKNIKVVNILGDLLGFEVLNKKSSEYGLRIFEVMIKSCECLSQFPEIESAFSNLSTAFKYIHANIVKDSSVFSVHQALISKLPYFNMQAIIDKSKKNEEHREKCRQIMKRRAEKINIAHFKNLNNIEPIFLYTSQLRVKEKGASSTLYNTVNTFMRSQIFGETERKQYQKWEYLFANRLLTQLQQAPKYIGPLYRGIKYSPKYKVGEIVEYKQFSSSSLKKESALNFAQIGLITFLNYKKGRRISELSYFEDEEEVIILPYSRFKVAKITSNVSNQSLGCQIEVIQMEAIPDEELPEPTCKIVLWVDDKSGPQTQAYKVCKKFTNSQTNTFIYHFKSTALLQQYLKNNKAIFKDPTVQIAMITNMARVQGNKKNDSAGIDAYKIFRTFLPDSFVLFYVGYMPATIDNLRKNNIPPSANMLISNSIDELFQFFYQRLRIY